MKKKNTPDKWKKIFQIWGCVVVFLFSKAFKSMEISTHPLLPNHLF